MSPFKKAKVILLPTGFIARRNEIGLQAYKTNLRIINNTEEEDLIFYQQHLYIISDDEIKEGDNFYNPHSGHLHIAGNHTDFKAIKENGCKKIIATTDTSLYIHQKETVSLPERVFYLPQPSQQFIKKYIEEYNKGQQITECLVEYELISNEEYFGNTINPDDDVPYFDERLKINSKDNTITIKKVKDNYSREEVDRLLDEQASKTTAEMLEKFKGYKSREEVIDLIVRAVSESHDWSNENNDIHSIGLIEKRFLNKWIEENL